MPAWALLDLPLEILRHVLFFSVLSRGVKRSLRLRLVCSEYPYNGSTIKINFCSEIFASEVTSSLFESRLLDHEPRLERSDAVTESYLVFRVLKSRPHDPLYICIIRRTAQTIYNEEGSTDQKRYIHLVNELCRLAMVNACLHRRSLMFAPQDIPQELDDAIDYADLVVASAYLGLIPLFHRWNDASVDFSEKSRVFSYAIQAAAIGGHTELVKHLITKGPGHFRRRTLAEGAFISGNVEMLDLTLTFDPFRSPDRGCKEGYQFYGMLEKGLRCCKFPHIVLRLREILIPNPHADSSTFVMWRNWILGIYAANNWYEMVRFIVDLDPVRSPAPLELSEAFTEACRRGHLEIFKLLLARGAVVANSVKDTDSPLLLAATGWHFEMVRLLVDQGADINLGTPPAIVRAVMTEHTEMFRFLRARGAVIHSQTTGAEALRIAKEQGLDSMVALLLEDGVKPHYSP